MSSLWQVEAGQLLCRWSETSRSKYNPPWMQQTSEVQSGYLPPLPDFADHSPFAGATWFWFLPENAPRKP